MHKGSEEMTSGNSKWKDKENILICWQEMEGNLSVLRFSKWKPWAQVSTSVCSRETFTHISKVAGTKIFFRKQ